VHLNAPLGLDAVQISELSSKARALLPDEGDILDEGAEAKIQELVEAYQHDSALSEEEIVAELATVLPPPDDLDPEAPAREVDQGFSDQPLPVHRRVMQLMLDVATRWNAKYLMIDRYYQLRSCINVILGTPGVAPELVLDRNEVLQLEAVMIVLRIFFHATTYLEGEKYCTLSAFIPLMALLKAQLQDDTLYVVRNFLLKTTFPSDIDYLFNVYSYFVLFFLVRVHFLRLHVLTKLINFALLL